MAPRVRVTPEERKAKKKIYQKKYRAEHKREAHEYKVWYYHNVTKQGYENKADMIAGNKMDEKYKVEA